jgi:HSP20 family protein
MSEQQTNITPVTSSTPAGAGPRWYCTPPIDIYETETGLVLQADLPGVTAEQLELQVQDNRLTLLGRVTSPVPENAQLIYQEYRVGDYLRSFILSDDVDHERVSAKMSDGVLEVTLPKVVKPEPRRIQIRAE